VVGRGSVAITEQIRQASDIVDVISAYVSLTRAGSIFKALCPFHQERTPSFTVNPTRQIFKCFGCGAGGDVFKFIQLRENVSFLEARSILAVRAGISLETVRSDPAMPETGPSRTELERANRWALRWFQRQLASDAGTAAREYLERRGVNRATAERFSLGFGPDRWDALLKAAMAERFGMPLLLAAGLVKVNTQARSSYDAFRNRLMFPILDPLGRVIGFGGRTLADDPAKYLNSPRTELFDKSRCLYGLDLAKEAFRSQRTAVVVEGYLDCVMAHQYGFPQTVATLGTALTVDHVRILRRYVDNVILVFDSDEAGQKAADQSLRFFLNERLQVRIAGVPGAKDPADLLLAAGREALERVLTSAEGALEFKWRQVSRRYRHDASPSERRAAVEEFIHAVASSADLETSDPIQRGLLLNQVAKLVALPAEVVHRLCRDATRQARRPQVAQGAPPAVSRRTSAAATHTAVMELLGVLLCEPSYWPSVESVFDPELVEEAEGRAIATALVEEIRRAGTIVLAQFISRFEAPETARRILDLHDAAAARGNFGGTVEGAVLCLQQHRAAARVAQMEAMLVRRLPERPPPAACGPPPAAEEEERTLAQAVLQGTRQIRGFAARRHIGDPPVAKTLKQPTATEVGTGEG